MARMTDIMQNKGRLYSLPNPDFQHPFKNVRNCGNKRGQIENHLWKKMQKGKTSDFTTKMISNHLTKIWKMPIGKCLEMVSLHHSSLECRRFLWARK